MAMKKLWIPADVSINCFCCHPEACLNLLSTSNYEVNREALINNTSGGEGGIMKNRIFITLTSVLLVVLAVIFVVAQGGCESKKGGLEVVGFPKSFADLAERTKPAVVNISSTSIVKVPGNPFKHFFGPQEGPFGDFFHHFFGNVPDREMKQQSLGSGFIIDKDGYIVTNNHVVAGAEEIKVKLADGREFKAKVIGRDEKTDLALLKISSLFKNLPVLPLGDSDKIRVGDWVIAIGNPFGLGHTVTQGIISATGRVIGSGPYDDFLQTDAPINPGNSGGPLIDLKGEVIGINSAIIASGQGIGFAIPSNIAKNVTAQLRERGKVIRGWIGVTIQTVTQEIAQSFGLKEPHGALVADVVPGGPAEKAGIKRGDIIVSFNGKAIKTSNDLPWLVAETPVGKTVDIKVIRSGQEKDLEIKIEEMTKQRVAEQTQAPVLKLGIQADNVTPNLRSEFGIKDKSGVVVVSVTPGSPADDAGIQAGDVIKQINHESIRTLRDYNEAMGKTGKGKPVLFLIKRSGKTFYVSIRVS
jgi:serine protease Do